MVTEQDVFDAVDGIDRLKSKLVAGSTVSQSLRQEIVSALDDVRFVLGELDDVVFNWKSPFLEDIAEGRVASEEACSPAPRWESPFLDGQDGVS